MLGWEPATQIKTADNASCGLRSSAGTRDGLKLTQEADRVQPSFPARRALVEGGAFGREELTGEKDGAESVLYTYLVVEAPDMPAHGVSGDVQGFGDRAIRFALCDQPEDLAFARCQTGPP